jgi:predicted peroxiredoxin
MTRSMVVKVTHAMDEPERAHIGCNVAAVALASGLEVALFLAIDGVHLARPGIPDHLQVADGPPTAELIEAIYAGGTVTVCTPCATRRGLGAEDFRPGTQLAGSARFVELATAQDATALVY